MFSFTVLNFHSDSQICVLYVNWWYKGTIQWYNSKMDQLGGLFPNGGMTTEN